MKTNYIETRLDDQMAYYRKKCASAQKEYFWMSTASIVINAVVPVLAMGVDVATWLRYIIAGLSAAASIISSIILLRKPKDIWIEYRSTYEKLKKEKILFETSSGKYKTGTEEDFILACEEIMENEHSAWEALRQNDKEKKE